MPSDDGIHFTINKFCLSCGEEPCRFIHPPAEKPSHAKPGKHHKSGPQAAAGEAHPGAARFAADTPDDLYAAYDNDDGRPAPPAGVPADPDKAEGVPQNSSANPDTGGEPPPNRPPARRSHE